MSGDPAARPTTAGSRGPVGRQPTLSPTGYRVSDRRRFELRMACLFTGQESLQDIVDLAVTEFLDRLRQQAGFQGALTAAEQEQQRRAGIRQSTSPA
jgi:hypothetical protein